MKTAHGRAVAGVAEQDAVERRIAELKIPAARGAEPGTIYFQPDIVVRAIDGFIVTLPEAVVIVIGVLVISMGVRSGLLIGASLLLTILSTFMAMSMYGVALFSASRWGPWSSPSA